MTKRKGKKDLAEMHQEVIIKILEQNELVLKAILCPITNYHAIKKDGNL